MGHRSIMKLETDCIKPDIYQTSYHFKCIFKPFIPIGTDDLSFYILVFSTEI